MSTTTTPNHHLAAILPSKGSPIQLTHRPTPAPGPTDLLIAVHSIALNPVDYFQRDKGHLITNYPAIVGSDIAGTVLAAGSQVTSPDLQPGARVAAFASTYYEHGNPDYGAFQERVLAPAAATTPLPESMGWNEGAILPMAVLTGWAGWNTAGLARDTNFMPQDKQAVLVWGGASSVGSAAVQVARSMGFAVYVTASEKHHAYMKTLGATKTFGYKDEDVVRKIVEAVHSDGVTMLTAYDAVIGGLKPCLQVLKEVKGEGKATLVSAPLPEKLSDLDGVEVKFVSPPQEAGDRVEFFTFVFNVWLKEKLASKGFVPSPRVQVVEGGMEALNKGLDELKKGVSGTKLVLEVKRE